MISFNDQMVDPEFTATPLRRQIYDMISGPGPRVIHESLSVG